MQTISQPFFALLSFLSLLIIISVLLKFRIRPVYQSPTELTQIKIKEKETSEQFLINERAKFILSKNITAKNNIQNQNKKALLVAQYRSGSTLISSMFDLHPFISYLFEPLILAPISATKTEKLNILNNLMNCRFPENLLSIAEYVQKNYDNLLRPDRSNIDCLKDCIKFNFCFKYLMSMFSENQLEVEKWPEYCHKSEISAAKIIRIDRLQDLFEPGDEVKTYYKIIYLIRDPRAIYNSRSKLHILTDHYGRIYDQALKDELCDKFRADVEYFENNRAKLKDWVYRSSFQSQFLFSETFYRDHQYVISIPQIKRPPPI